MLVFSNGCYDALHPGHFNLLMYCRYIANNLAGKEDKVVVAIDSDEKIKQDKGADRPIFPQEERRNNLLALRYFATYPLINEVYVFHSSDELRNLIASFQPDALVIGDEWKGKHVVGAEFVREPQSLSSNFGIHYFPRVPNISTSTIIEKVKCHEKES